MTFDEKLFMSPETVERELWNLGGLSCSVQLVCDFVLIWHNTKFLAHLPTSVLALSLDDLSKLHLRPLLAETS